MDAYCKRGLFVFTAHTDWIVDRKAKFYDILKSFKEVAIRLAQKS